VLVVHRMQNKRQKRGFLGSPRVQIMTVLARGAPCSRSKLVRDSVMVVATAVVIVVETAVGVSTPPEPAVAGW
jgi:hypothetical protein